MLKGILAKASNVTMTMCLDPDEMDVSTNSEDDIFYYNKKCAKQLIEYARELGVQIEEPVLLKNEYRFKTEELKHLENNIYKLPYEKYTKQVNSINLLLASNPYSEVENMAGQIVKLVKNEGYEYRDIAVSIKNLGEYESIIKIIFAKYDIPFFIDRKNELNQNILIKYVLGVLDVFAKNWSLDAMLEFIKSPFVYVDDKYKLENYCIKWGIKGSKWYKEDWNYDADKIDINKMNNMRKQIVIPLLKLKNNVVGAPAHRCPGGCGQPPLHALGITKELYQFLEQNKIREILNKKINDLKNAGQPYIAEEYKKSFDILIDLLDEIVLIFGTEKMTFSNYSKILQVGLKNSNLGKIPQLIDQVIVGDVDRTRSNKIKALFIINVNDGVFPELATSEGFLNDNDRTVLKDSSLEIAKGTMEKLYIEDQFNIYKAFSTAENNLFLSYLMSDKNGRSLRPSILISKIKKIFPELQENSDLFWANDDVLGQKQAFDLLLHNLKDFQNGKQIDVKWFKIYNYFLASEEWKTKLQNSIKGLNYNNGTENIKLSNNVQLLKTSISRLEQYRQCPFSYYLKYGLKLQEKNEFKIKSIDTGSFMHEVIDDFFKTANIYANTAEDNNKLINDIIDNKLNLHKNKIFTLAPKFIVLTNRLRKVIIKSIEYIVYQIKNSNFKILGNEVEFKEKREDIEITGKIDRIDIGENEDGKFIRIIDYKSSNKNIDLNEVMVGIQLQLITYIDSVARDKYMPAGILYFSLIDPIIKSNKNLTNEEIEVEIKKSFKMQGLILADVKIIKMMDNTLEQGHSKIIPVAINSDGTISKTTTSTITKEEFTILQKKAQKIIKEISQEIMGGNIEIKPTYNLKTKTSACKFCSYRSICAFDPSCNNYKYIGTKTKEEIFAEMS